MSELDDEIYEQITSLSASGDLAAQRQEYDLARKLYFQAFALLPDPKSDWDAYTWLWAAIGDSYFFENDWEGCLDAFLNAVNGPDGMGNPFLHLRLGQSFYNLGQEKKALDEFVRAYMGGGLEIFEGSEVPYLEFLKKHVEL